MGQPTPTESTSTILWLDPEQLETARALRDKAGLEFVAVGSPQLGHAEPLASALDARPTTDLRAAIMSAGSGSEEGTRVVLLLSPGEFGSPDSASPDDDQRALREARKRNVKVICVEPIPAGVLQLAGPALIHSSRDETIEPWARHAPILSRTRGVHQFQDLRESFGRIRTVHVAALCAPHQRSLGACLYDAVELVQRLVGDPELVGAAYSTALAGGGLLMEPGESLRNLTGELTVTMRFGDGRSAGLFLSDRAGRWQRSVTLIGENGTARFSDSHIRWTDAKGELVDSSGSEDPGEDGFVDVLAEQIRRIVDPHRPAEQPVDAASVLATAGSAVLSARTAELESPSTLRRMVLAG